MVFFFLRISKYHFPLKCHRIIINRSVGFYCSGLIRIALSGSLEHQSTPRSIVRFINSSSLLRFDWIHYTFLSISLLQFRIIVYQLRFPRNTNKSFWKLGWNKNETWARLKQNGFTTSVLIIFREGTLAFKLNALRHDCSKRLKAFDSRDNRVSPRPPCSAGRKWTRDEYGNITTCI